MPKGVLTRLLKWLTRPGWEVRWGSGRFGISVDRFQDFSRLRMAPLLSESA